MVQISGSPLISMRIRAARRDIEVVGMLGFGGVHGMYRV